MTVLTALFVGVFLLSTVIEAGIKDSITISVDDTDFLVSKTEMKNMLDKADLEGHGYKREEVTKLTKDSNGRKLYSKTLFYFKAVKCSVATQTIQELKNLLPGIMTPSLDTRLQTDLQAQNTAGQMCKIGLKTVLNDTTTKRNALRPKRGWGGWNVRANASVSVSNGKVSFKVSVKISCCNKG